MINFFENNLGNVEVLSLVQGDFILAGAAGVMVVIIVGLQTGSWTLALVGMLNVGLSYPVGLVLYHGLLGIQVNTTLNQLALYVILGTLPAHGILLENPSCTCHPLATPRYWRGRYLCAGGRMAPVRVGG